MMHDARKSPTLKLALLGVLCGVQLPFTATVNAQVNTPALAQPAGVKTGKAAIVGVVVDSLRGGYLVGAEVFVEGARTSGRTDSLGRFALDSLVPGTYRVGIFHPILDTLGIAPTTKPFHLGPDSASVVILSVPSAATLISQSCTGSPASLGNSAVIGQVMDPETLRPVPGADVSLAWMEFEATKKAGFKMTPRVVRDITDDYGRFSLCGLPSAMEANLQAKRGNSVTTEVTIALGESPTALVARTLLLSPTDSSATPRNAVVSGRVTLEGNAVTGGSRVTLAGTDAVTTTDAKGEFTLRNLPSGTNVLVARHIGYAATAVAVDLSAREPKTVTITLPKTMNIMEPVLVTARRTAALERVGFVRRQRAGWGHYFGPEQIERMRPSRLTDILRLVPSLRINRGRYGEEYVTSGRTSSVFGGACVQYYVDNMRWRSMTPGDVNLFVSGREVAGVEVYLGPFVPVEYVGGMERCTTIVVWTKMRIHD